MSADHPAVYVAGPMRGFENFNFPAFDAAAERLRALGYEVFNPADRDRDVHGHGIADNPDGDEDKAAADHGFSLRDALGDDTAWIAAHADAVAVLPGWENSKGAQAEVALARALGLVVAPIEHFVSATLPTSSEEIRSVSTTGGEKGTKPERYDLIPAEPLRLLARLYGEGAKKYADRNWERGYEFSKSFSALNRHLWLWWSGEDLDAETGVPHTVNVAWHAFALTQFAQGGRYAEFDDRPRNA